MYKIYLAPANHYNEYVISGYNEKTQCEKLAKLIEKYLNKYEVEVMYTTVFSDTRQYHGRPEEAAEWGADLYLAIHDNAYNGRTGGAQAFYHKESKDDLSYKVASSLVTNLNAICSVTPKIANPVRDGMTAFNGAGYGEIREPYNRGIAPVIFEVNFHDYEPAARYLIDNQDSCARTIVKSLANVMNLKYKESEGTEMKVFNKGDHVQVVNNIEINSKGNKTGRVYGSSSRFVIYLDEYIVSGATNPSTGRTVISDFEGNVVAAVYSKDLELVEEVVVPDPVPEIPDSNDFTDVKSFNWFYDAVKFCSSNGIVNGYPNDDKFYPNKTATRAEVCQMIYNLCKYLESQR